MWGELRRSLRSPEETKKTHANDTAGQPPRACVRKNIHFLPLRSKGVSNVPDRIHSFLYRLGLPVFTTQVYGAVRE